MDQFELDYIIGDSPISPDHKELLDRAANKIEATIPRGGRDTAIDTAVGVAVGDLELDEITDAWRRAKAAEQKAFHALQGATIFLSTVRDSNKPVAGQPITNDNAAGSHDEADIVPAL